MNIQHCSMLLRLLESYFHKITHVTVNEGHKVQVQIATKKSVVSIAN